VLYCSGKVSESIKVFELNTLLFPNETGTFLSLANTLGTMGKSRDAILNYEKVLKIDPENEEAISAIRMLNSKNID
jgi:tetratricopeptide (TPR) repeat protein